jgi:uncharacterized DUF497 family protein
MLRIRRLIFDAWNVAHIARHGVTQEEVEEVCHGTPVVQEGKKDRSLVFGPTTAGRMLTVVLDPEPAAGHAVYYVVTARPASRRERAIWAQAGGNGAGGGKQ